MPEEGIQNCSVAVIGLGRIGLPLSLSLVNKGLKVLGIESNKETVSKLHNNVVPFNEPGTSSILKENLGTNYFPVYAPELNNYQVSNIKYVIVAVGVHNIKSRYPEPFEYDSIVRVIDYLNAIDLLKGRTLILRPTQPIGSTKRVQELISKKFGLTEGNDYYIAYMPERILEGSALEEEDHLPKIVGAASDESFDKVNNLLSKLGGQVLRVSSPEVAEFVKLLDNSWRHTTFAFANDAALAAENAGISAHEAIKAANLDYPRNSIPLPGPVSGYCLGKDPYILEYAFRDTEKRRNFNSIWFYSALSSKYLLDHIISKVSGNKVMLMGLSFKKNTDDYRLSHGVALLNLLIKGGYSVSVIDQYHDTNDYTKLEEDIKDKIQIVTKIEHLDEEEFDSVIISIDNEDFYGKEDVLAKHGKIIDLWNIYNSKASLFKDYWSLGGFIK